MTLPSPIPSRPAGEVRCPRCKRWRPLHMEAIRLDADGNALEFGPPLAVCCNLAFLVQPDGTPEVYDLGAEAQPEEDCA